MADQQELRSGALSRAEIERTIDDLDMALAAGKIDLATHQRLNDRWRSKLAATSDMFNASTALAPSDATRFITRPAMPAPSQLLKAVQAAAPAIVPGAGLPGQPAGLGPTLPRSGASNVARVACPECGAPVSSVAGDGSLIRCEYCGATFTTQKAEAEGSRLQEELRRWLDAMVTSGAAGSMVDAASRHFIFCERLFPTLNLEVSRHLEPFELLRAAPLCLFRGGRLFSMPSAAPLVPMNASLLSQMIERVNAPEVRSFAVTPEDRGSLDALAIRAGMVLRLGTAFRQIQAGAASNYRAAQKNVEAVAAMVHDASRGAQGAQAAFFAATAARFATGAKLLGALAALKEQRNPDLNGLQASLERASQLFTATEQALERSGYAPIEVLSARRGLEADREQIRLLSQLLVTYERASGGVGLPLDEFIERLEEYAKRVGLRLATASAIHEFLQTLGVWLGGSEFLVRAVHDWAWIPAAVDSQRHHGGMFRKSEVVATQREYWHPFHCFPLRYSAVKGAVFKGGVEESGYALVSAIGSADVFLAGGGTRLLAAIDGATPGLPRDTHDRPLPLRAVGESAAAATQYCRAQPTLINPRLGNAHILLLPAFTAVLEAAGQQRALNLTAVAPADGSVEQIIATQTALLGSL